MILTVYLSLDSNISFQAGALMVVGLLASRGSLSIKLSNSLIHAIGRTAHQDSKELSSVPWLQLALMSIAAIIQVSTVMSGTLIWFIVI